MTDLESPKKNNDCYFYYYSTCSKGDSCGFRHEPSALGCETMCSFWKEGKCLNIHCNFRHMELRKNRKVIPCYWESQPGGCLKPHCPFLHQNQRPLASDESKLSKPENALPENCTQAGNFKSTSSVDSLVVNFEEESDSESAPSTSPAKICNPKVKTLEEIKLEKIAAACAAYYSYPDDTSGNDKPIMQLGAGDLRQRILQRVKSKKRPTPTKLSSDELAYILGDSSLTTNPDSSEPPLEKRRKITETDCTIASNDFKIKTLEEIRSERNNRQEQTEFPKTLETIRKTLVPIKLSRTNNKSQSMETEESVVSSTSNEEPEVPLKPLRKLNLKKIKPRSEETESVNKSIEDENMEDLEEISVAKLEKSASSKTVDESLLLLDDDGQDININIKSEDDLLNEIDILLDD